MMNQNKYRMEIDSIKASERLKSRIIQEVETKDRGEDKIEKFVRIFAGTVAIAGIAVVMYLAYRGGMESDEGKLRPASDTKEEVTLESSTGLNVMDSKHDMSLPENTNLVYVLNNAEDDGLGKVKFDVTNDGNETEIIMPEFWVVESSDDYEKGYCLEEVEPENVDEYKGSEIVIKPGETRTIDVSDEFAKKYPQLLKEEREAYIVFYTRGAKDNEPTGIFYVQTGITLPLFPVIRNPYINKGDDEIKVGFFGLFKEDFSGKASCTLLRRNTTTFELELLGGINWESEINCSKMKNDEEEVYTDDRIISIPSSLEPGEYFLEFTIVDDNTGFSAKRTEDITILNDQFDAQLVVEMDKDVYSMDEINDMGFSLKTTNGNVWKNIEYEVFKVKDETDFERMDVNGYSDSGYYEDAHFEIPLLDEAEYGMEKNIEPGKYMLVVTADDGNTKQVGVGEVKTNVVRVKTEFDIVK